MASQMKTIFEALRESHDKQRRLLAALSDTHGDTDKRDGLFAVLKAELVHHENAEERHFYAPMMEFDTTQETARHSVAEHHEIDELIEELESTDYSSPGWLIAARKLEHLVRHHVDEEEVFQAAGKVFSDSQKTGLAREYDQMMAAQANS